MDNDFTQLEAIQTHIEASDYNSFGQSTQLIFEEIVRLNAWNAFVGKKVAEYGRDYKGKKELAYQAFMDSKSKLSASLAKDFIDSTCGETEFLYAFAERLNRTIVHYLDSLRTILSTLKQEMATIQYSGSIR